MRLIAFIELMVCWFAWWYPFIFRVPHYQKRRSVVRRGPTWLGLLLEAAAIFMAFAMRLGPANPPAMERVVAAMILAPIAPWMAWGATRELGRQFRINAGLYEDHVLVRTGTYGLVRHPIYASLLAILLATLLILTPWPWILVSVGLFVTGTEIRVRCEDRLLASRFGAAFDEYRKRVPAYLPFVR